MIVSPGNPLRMILEPSETTCPICPGEIGLELSERSEKNALLLCVEGTQSIQIRTKRCPECDLKVSYKDNDKYAFNFNDNLVLSHRLLERW